MIFSAKKWNNGKELKAVMKVNTAISFDMIEAPLRNAFRQYLVPLLGDAMAGEVVEIYEFGPNPDVLEQNTEGATEREKLDSRLLEICKRANANLAFWNDFDEISMRITDAGFQRQKSDNGESFQQVYKYQEDNLRASLRNKGFNALDELLEGGLLEGFFDEVDGAALEGVHGHGHVSVARDEDDGQLGLAGQKVFLHFKTTHARHAHVKHENRNGLRVVLGDEALAAVVELDAVVARLEEPLQGVADGVVIVDDIDRAQCFRGFGTVVIGKHERNLSSEKVP